MNVFKNKVNLRLVSVIIIFSLIFVFILLCNIKTNLVSDDYCYMFNFSDETKRIEKVSDIFQSMVAHRRLLNGRVFAHFIVQLALLLPIPLFRTVNSLMFVALLILIYHIGKDRKEDIPFLPILLFGGIWVLQKDFGQVYLWLDGSINYLWSAVFCLLWIIPWVNEYRNNGKMNTSKTTFYCLFSFFVGAYSENSTVAIGFMAVLFLLLTYQKQGKLFTWQIVSIVMLGLGFLFLMIAPAEYANKSSDFSYQTLRMNFSDLKYYYRLYWPAIVSFCILYIASYLKHHDRGVRLLSIVFFLGSIVGQFVLTFAKYCAGRSTYIALVLLLVASAILFADLSDDKPLKPSFCVLTAVILSITLYWCKIGFTDIKNINELLTENENTLITAAARGDRTVSLPVYIPATEYPAVCHLSYLDVDDPYFWSNNGMARYYGFDYVEGYWG